MTKEEKLDELLMTKLGVSCLHDILSIAYDYGHQDAKQALQQDKQPLTATFDNELLKKALAHLKISAIHDNVSVLIFDTYNDVATLVSRKDHPSFVKGFSDHAAAKILNYLQLNK